MTEAYPSQTTVVRTSRGLSIAGTRITLYDVMDYLTAGWPVHVDVALAQSYCATDG